MPSSQPSYAPQWADHPPEFNCEAYADGPGVARLSLIGELDLATAPKLDEALAGIPDATAVVILDLSELTFMDSTGLHLIVSATARLAAAGRRLALVPGGRHIQQIFEMTGTRNQLEFVSRRPNAIDIASGPDDSQGGFAR